MKRRISPILSIILICLCFAGCTAKNFADGTYSVDVTLSGGTGRASIEEATVVIEKGNAIATIVWSSPYYEYMLIGEAKYEPIQKSGNSTIKIPVVLDEEMKVSALTVAMSQPHLVEYTLCFDSSTLKGE